MTAIWRVQPASLKVEAVAGGKTITVAQTPGDPGRDFIDFDFAAAARGLCEPAYAAAVGQTDLGLTLRVTATGPGAARLRLSQAGVRYLQRPLVQPVKLGLRGAPETVELRGADRGLHPVALDLSVQGKLLPDRLTDGSDEQPPDPRRGLVANAGIRLARRTALTPVERALPVGAYCRVRPRGQRRRNPGDAAPRRPDADRTPARSASRADPARLPRHRGTVSH